MKTNGLPKPRWLDVLLLSIFTILITLHPYYLQNEINLYELGLYLPGIDTILRHGIPYRDCFHLRGPFELYMPAFLMKAFGPNVAVLSTYFYVGTVIGLIVCVILGAQLYRTRFLLYLMVLVLIGRTFPRVAFTFWGGMRFAFGLMAMAAMVQFFKTQKFRWLFLSGIFAACGFFTSPEVGVCTLFGLLVALVFALVVRIFEGSTVRVSLSVFLCGMAVVAGPFLSYLIVQHAFVPWLDNVVTVVTQMQKTFDLHITMEIPRNFKEALAAMFDPLSTNFKHMTPAYFYLVLVGYFVWKIWKKKIEHRDLAIVCLAGYGILMYNTSFRLIWASQFEMALQPEKILLFFILEQVYLKLREKLNLAVVVGQGKEITKKLMAGVIIFLIFGLVGSSLGYAIARYNNRFVAYKFLVRLIKGEDMTSLHPLYGKEHRVITAERAKGMVAPVGQVEEIEKLAKFFAENTKEGETVFIFPELGFHSFIINRPFVGRFPMVTMSWFKESWHEEFMKDLKSEMPRYAIIDKDPGPAFPAIFFKLERNKRKYDEVVEFIKENYTVVDESSGTWIYQMRPKLTER